MPDPDGSRVVLPDGTVVEGRPHDTDEYRATARALGYGDDTLAMCRDHDPLHARLADWLGLPCSYGMLAAAGRLDPGDLARAHAEEAAVLAVQKFVKTL